MSAGGGKGAAVAAGPGGGPAAAVVSPGPSVHRLLVVRPLRWALAGALALVGLYAAVLAASNSLEHAWRQFLALWPWMSALVAGFALQLGLFGYLTGYKTLAEAKAAGGAAVAASSGISSAAMIACCLHHVADLLPVLGLSAAAGLLGAYQAPLLALGVAANGIGTAYLLRTMQVHHLYRRGGTMAALMRLPMRRVLYLAGVLGVGLVAWQVAPVLG